jgi:hypothetical protein
MSGIQQHQSSANLFVRKQARLHERGNNLEARLLLSTIEKRRNEIKDHTTRGWGVGFGYVVVTADASDSSAALVMRARSSSSVSLAFGRGF